MIIRIQASFCTQDTGLLVAMSQHTKASDNADSTNQTIIAPANMSIRDL